MSKITVHHRHDTLTDGSIAHDVVVRGHGQEVAIPCYSDRCAEALQQAIVDAINLHGADHVEMGEDIHIAAGWAA